VWEGCRPRDASVTLAGDELLPWEAMRVERVLRTGAPSRSSAAKLTRGGTNARPTYLALMVRRHHPKRLGTLTPGLDPGASSLSRDALWHTVGTRS
jgi:hypothetical protein